MTTIPNQQPRKKRVKQTIGYISDLLNFATKEEVDQKAAIAEEIKRRLDALAPVTMRQPRTANEIIERQNQIAEAINSLALKDQQ